MSKPIFYEGQAVGCLMFGEGVIKEMDSYHIRVEIKEGIRTFYPNGKYEKDSRHTLYPIEQYRQIIATLPAPEPEKWQPNPGEWCWFWDDSCQGKQPVLSRFVSIIDDFFKAEFYKWKHCAPFIGELPEHLKEVKE